MSEYMDRMNHTFEGGFGGIAHAAKKYTDVHPAFRDATEWAKAAQTAHKAGDERKAVWYAVEAAARVSEGGCAVAVGWIHREDSQEPKVGVTEQNNG